jgi:peptidoglycan glycosyltransferase
MEELFANPRFQQLLAEPYPEGVVPLEFAKPSWLVRKPICRLPGPYGNYREELFAADMLADPAIPAALPGALPAQPTQAPASDGCSLYDEVTVAQLSDVAIDASGIVSDTAAIGAAYCAPQPGDPVPAEALQTVSIWKLPPPDPSEQISYTWEGMAARLEDRTILPVRADAIPPCSPEQLTVFAPPIPGAVRMPDLARYGENQAKEILSALGITNFYVDYQTRDRIPEIFDQYVPYAILSTLPGPGEWVTPDQTVVLGVRAPEE